MRFLLSVATVLALGCGGGEVTEPDPEPTGPEWVSVSGTWHATRINGEELPYRLGLYREDCQEGPSYRRLGRVEVDLESGPETAEWKPAEIGWGSSTDICDFIRGGSNASYDGTHRERTDSIFITVSRDGFGAEEGLYLYGGEWTESPGGSFIMQGAYRSSGTTTEMEIRFDPGEHQSY